MSNSSSYSIHTHPSYCNFKLSFPGISTPREKMIPRKSHIFVQITQPDRAELERRRRDLE